MDEWSAFKGPEELTKLIGEHWKSSGILNESEGPFVDVCFTDIFKCIDVLIIINNSL